MKKSHIAAWTSISPTPEQLKELFVQITEGRIDKEKMQTFLHYYDQFSKYDLARIILGSDFISPEEIEEAYKITYSDDMLQHFNATLPSEKVIRWCRKNNFMLIAGPPTPMSLMQVREFNLELVHQTWTKWYEEPKEEFSRADKVNAKWLMLRKKIVPHSTSETWGDQLNLLSKVEYVPNVSEAVWGITAYKKIRDVFLFPDVYARTSSADSSGRNVKVGFFGKHGFFAAGLNKGFGLRVNFGDERNISYYFVGILSARTPNNNP